MTVTGVGPGPAGAGGADSDAVCHADYEHDLQDVFGRTWLFVGHTSMVAKRGDYVSTYMGEDPVILIRGAEGQLHVLLNKCRHRGNRVCLFDRGNSWSFTCSYHGWSYTGDGRLKGVPFQAASYGDGFDKSKWGLVRVPRVEELAGLVFASWSATGPDLASHLGDAAPYLRDLVLDECIGGLDVLPGVHRYVVPANWRVAAQSFVGDGRAVEGDDRRASPHRLLDVRFGDAAYQHDRDQAAALGQEAVDWVERRQAARSAWRSGQHPDPLPYGVEKVVVFPNFAVVGRGSALGAAGLTVWMPRGPHETQVWQWCAVNRDAPPSVQRRQRDALMAEQSAAAVSAAEDHARLERLPRSCGHQLSSAGTSDADATR